MKLRTFLPLAAALAAPVSALTVTGSVSGQAPAGTRVGVWSVTAFGQPVEEMISAPLAGGTFSLNIPERAPAARALSALTPQNVNWPGVIDPVAVSGAAQAAELKFYLYQDANGNARRDTSEALREVSVTANRATLFMAWVSADVTVKANKGYVATLKQGLNAFLVDVGRAVNVEPYRPDLTVHVQLGR